jgi:hypothetical protein
VSSRTSDLTDIERDIPTTPEDVEVLRRLRRTAPRQPFEAVQALADALPPAARRPRRTTAAGRPDFEL